MTKNTALQVTNFNFYGDELIALKDNATGEIILLLIQFLEGLDLQTMIKSVKNVTNGLMTLLFPKVYRSAIVVFIYIYSLLL